jgi:dUTP pyrophosphatase
MKIKIKKLKADAIIPAYAHPGDAGLDLHSVEDYELKPGEKKVFYLGFSLEFPPDYVALVKDRGSMAAAGIHSIAGVVDASFRGEYMSILINLSNQSYQIKKGDRIAQLLIVPLARAEIEEVEELESTSRGDGHLGSTGK